MHPPPFLSIVVPVFNEGAVVDELVRRCVAAGEASGRPFELVVADDASTDDTGARLQRLAAADPRVRHQRLDRNAGQFGATRAGLAAARGDWLCVLDGDLQDPPELVPALVAALGPGDASDVTVVFAAKTGRVEPGWFHAGRAGYRALQAVLGAGVPSGVGSYSLFSRAMAAQVARVPARSANLAAVLVALGAEVRTVSYRKAARYDGESRVGPLGLVKEALGSLLILSPLGARRLGEARPLRPRRTALAPACFVAGLLVLALLRYAEVAAFVHARLHFAMDDWEWLVHGRSFATFLEVAKPWFYDVYRPLAWAQYLVLHSWLGLDAGAMGVVALTVSLLAYLGIAWALVRAGVDRPVALLAAVAAFTGEPSIQSTQLFSLNETTLARAATAVLWLSFLGPRPRARYWGPALLAGFLSHESFVTAAPLLVLLVWHRGGVAEVRARFRERPTQLLVAAWTALTVGRVAMYLTAPGGTHVLVVGAASRNLRFFLESAESAWRAWSPAPSNAAPLPFVVVVVMLSMLQRGRRHVAAAVVSGIVLLGIAPHWLPIAITARAAPLLILGAVAVVRGRAGLRTLAFGLVFATITYTPFLLQRDYVSWYFLHLAQVGILLPLALVLPPRWPTRPLPALATAAVALALATTVVPRPSMRELYPDHLPDKLLSAVETQLRPERDGVTTVLFVEAPEGTRNVQDGFVELRSTYLTSIGSSFAWGPDGKPLDHMTPVNAFTYRFPGRTFHTMVVRTTDLDLLCLRDDDVLVAVGEGPGEPPTYVPTPWSGPRTHGLPRALADGTPEGRAFADALRAQAGNELAARALASARRACESRQALRTAESARHAAEAVAALWQLPGGPHAGPALALRKALRTMTRQSLERVHPDGTAEVFGHDTRRPSAPNPRAEGR